MSRSWASFSLSGIILAGAFQIASAQTPEQLFQQALDNLDSRPAESERLLREALRKRPNWFDARFALGAALTTLHRPIEAITELETAHRLNPTHSDCAKLLASEYLGLDRASDALRIARPLTNSTAPDEEAYLLTIEALHLRNDAGDATEALRLGQKAMVRHPRSPRILAWNGFALRESGDLAGALKLLQQAAALSTDDPTVDALLADIARRQNRHQDALRLFDRVLAQSPGEEEALIGKARTLAALGRPAQAVDLIRAAVTAAPAAPRLRLELSQLYARLGDSENAAAQAAEFRRLRGAAAVSTIPSGLRTAAPSQ